MASAPTPGQTRPRRRGIRITLPSANYELDFADLGPADALAVRKESGLSLRELLEAEHFDLDSLGVLIWLVRRRYAVATKATPETLEQVLQEMPSYAELHDDVLVVEELTDEAEDDGSPEA